MGRMKNLNKFAKIFVHKFPLATTAQTTKPDIVNVNLSVLVQLFSCIKKSTLPVLPQSSHFTPVDPTENYLSFFIVYS